MTDLQMYLINLPTIVALIGAVIVMVKRGEGWGWLLLLAFMMFHTIKVKTFGG